MRDVGKLIPGRIIGTNFAACRNGFGDAVRKPAHLAHPFAPEATDDTLHLGNEIALQRIERYGGGAEHRVLHEHKDKSPYPGNAGKRPEIATHRPQTWLTWIGKLFLFLYLVYLVLAGRSSLLRPWISLEFVQSRSSARFACCERSTDGQTPNYPATTSASSSRLKSSGGSSMISKSVAIYRGSTPVRKGTDAWSY